MLKKAILALAMLAGCDADAGNPSDRDPIYTDEAIEGTWRVTFEKTPDNDCDTFHGIEVGDEQTPAPGYSWEIEQTELKDLNNEDYLYIRVKDPDGLLEGFPLTGGAHSAAGLLFQSGHAVALTFNAKNADELRPLEIHGWTFDMADGSRELLGTLEFPDELDCDDAYDFHGIAGPAVKLP